MTKYIYFLASFSIPILLFLLQMSQGARESETMNEVVVTDSCLLVEELN